MDRLPRGFLFAADKIATEAQTNKECADRRCTFVGAVDDSMLQLVDIHYNITSSLESLDSSRSIPYCFFTAAALIAASSFQPFPNTDGRNLPTLSWYSLYSGYFPLLMPSVSGVLPANTAQ